MPFPSPAIGYEDAKLDDFIIDYLIPKPSCTLLWTISEDFDLLHLAVGDIVIIERGRTPHNGCTALVDYDGDTFLCQLFWQRSQWYIATDTRKGKVNEQMVLVGVARSSIKNQLI